MTEATQAPPSVLSRTAPSFHYQVAMPQPTNHLFEVTLTVDPWQGAQLDLKLPVWTPGSYLVREYAKHLQDFQVQDGEGRSLGWRKVSKNHWQVETQGCSTIQVRYRVYANELSVRTNHLDGTHGYFNGAALFFYVPGWEGRSLQVTIVPPDAAWRVVTSLKAVAGQTYTFEAENFDDLVDSPFEVGIHATYEFEALGIPHQWVIWGQGNFETQRLIADTQKIIQVEADLFGGLPYDRYLFLLHLSTQGNGGLEHKFSCSLNYPRFGFRAKDKYQRFMQLVAHEFFHLWNVKRLRPKALEVFDYEQENYTPSLWFSEGTTSYYDLLIPLRAGIYDAATFLQNLSKEITRLQTTPGRLVQPVSESSWDAWIKLYRQDANSNNSQISYYLKGELVSLLLDLLIRRRFQNQRSLDDVMRQLWVQFGQPEIGFTPDDLKQAIESVAGLDLSDFFRRYVDGVEELPFDSYLEPFGLRLLGEAEDNAPPFLGLNAKTEAGREVVKFVEMGSPAQQAGLDAGDELLAIDGFRVSSDQLSDRLRDYQPGDTLHLTWFHQDELRTGQATLTAPRPTRFQVVSVDRLTSDQQKLCQGWLESVSFRQES